MEEKLFKNDIARRISKKYKGVSIIDAETFIDIFLDEILCAVLEDKLTVDLHRVCRIGIKYCDKVGYNFNSKKHFTQKGVFKIWCRPNNYIKEQACKMSEKIPECIGGGSKNVGE